MLKLKRKKLSAFFIVIICIVSFWATGIIPSFIARVSAQSYVTHKYGDKELKFSKVSIPRNFKNYFVEFTDKSGKSYGFVMSRYVPATIMYDPLDPPG